MYLLSHGVSSVRRFNLQLCYKLFLKIRTLYALRFTIFSALRLYETLLLNSSQNLVKFLQKELPWFMVYNHVLDVTGRLLELLRTIFVLLGVMCFLFFTGECLRLGYGTLWLKDWCGMYHCWINHWGYLESAYYLQWMVWQIKRKLRKLSFIAAPSSVQNSHRLCLVVCVLAFHGVAKTILFINHFKS
jgi:hypothetical protein